MIETAVSARRDLQLIRFYYFLSIGAGGFLLPFLSLFFRRQGLSGAEIGLLGTVQAVVGLAAAPIVGRLSDRFDRPRRLLQTMLVGMAVAGLILGRQSEFVWIALLVGLTALLSAGWAPLSDNLASSVAERFADVGFGSIRLWGSLGWTLVTAVAGQLIERLGLYFAFVGQAVGFGLATVAIHFLPRQPQVSSEWAAETAIPGNVRQVVAAIRRNPRLTNLALGLGFVWLLSSGLYQFEAIYLDELGATETTIGVANAINAAVELPAMLWADRLLKRQSAGWLLRLGFLLQAARMVGILANPTVPMILLLRLLLGVQFSLYSVGIIGFVNTHAPRAYRITALALITVTLRNLTSMVSNPLSGLVYDAVGAYWLYGLGLVGALGGWLALQWGKSSDAPS